MILETILVASGVTYLYRKSTEELRAERYKIKDIKNKWNTFLEGIGVGVSENKIKQKYEIKDVFLKHYGFDCIMSLPYGTDAGEFRSLIPKIQVVYGAEVIAEPVFDNKSVYMRVHTAGLDISEKDKIKFEWYKMFHSGNTVRNSFSQTFTIDTIKDICSPYNNDEVVGYHLYLKIPNGLSYATLKGFETQIGEALGKSIVKWNDKENRAEIEIIVKPLSDDFKFKPIKTKTPYELVLAMSYAYKVIIANLSKTPHLLYTGKTQTGKTVAVLSGITNLAYYYNEDDFILFESMISAKQDLRIFENLRQCMYYANNIDKSLRMFKYIKNEMYRRNRLFKTSKKFCAGMYSWNKMYPKEKLPLILLAVDEMTLYSPKKSDNQKIAGMKQECVDILTQLLIEGASAGINVLFSLQRPDKDSLNTTIKGQIGNIIGFYQPNSASSLVAMDDTRCTTLAHEREAIIKYSEGNELVKTLFLTYDMIEELLKDKMIGTEHHLNLNSNGELKEVKPEKETQSTTKDTKNDKEKDTKKDVRYFTNLTKK